MLQICGIELNREQINKIRSSKRTNRSSRRPDLDYYYDRYTAELVQSKERLIIEKYGYSMPNIR